LIFIGGDRLVESRFGDGGAGGALGIVLGAVVDAIPESIILGIQVALGIPVSMAFIFAVWISNIPQSLAPSVDLAEEGWSKAKVALMWGGVVVASALAAGLGFLLASNINSVNGSRMAALAAGGILAMLTDSLMPFAYERGGKLTGIWTVVGFAVAFAM
jgi:ZIP family zinc transporter